MQTRSSLVVATLAGLALAGCSKSKDKAKPVTKPAVSDGGVRAATDAAPPPPKVGRPKPIKRKVQILAEGLHRISALAADATYVYWLEATPKGRSGRLMRVAKAGGKPQEIASGFRLAAQRQPSPLLLDGRRIYLVANQAVHYINKTGGALTLQNKSAKNLGAMDAANIYWIGGERVYRWPRDNRLKGRKINIADDQSSARSVVADGKHVYWVVSGKTPAVVRQPSGGGKTSVVSALTGTGIPRLLRLDGDHYWLLRTNGLVRGTLSGGKPEAVALSRAPLHTFWVDNKHLVWPYGQRIYTLDKASRKEAAYQLDWGDVKPRPNLYDKAIVSDDTHIYMTTFGQRGKNLLVRFAK